MTSPYLSGQNTFGQGEYTYSFNGDLVYGATFVDFEETATDTSGNSVHLFSIIRNNQFFDEDTVSVSSLPDISVFEINSDAAYFSLFPGGNKNLLYDFSLAINDVYTIYPIKRPEPYSDSMTVRVSGYGDTIISGEVVDYQAVEYTSHRLQSPFPDTLFKGIGSLKYYFDVFDLFRNLTGGGQAGPLVCYNSAEISVENQLPEFSLNEISRQCLSTTPLNEINSVDINVFPNPVKNLLFIAFGSDEQPPEKIEIFRMDGSLVRNLSTERVLHNSTLTLNLQDCPPGIYFLRVQNFTHKIVKL